MRTWLSRRRVLSLVAGMVGFGTASSRAEAGDVTTQDYCYWKKLQGPLCSGGQMKEYWCEYCNDPGTGSNVTRCEWRIVGRC